MKFQVIHGYNSEVTVKLHWETKAKLKRVAFWSAYGAGMTSVLVYVYKNR